MGIEKMYKFSGLFIGAALGLVSLVVTVPIFFSLFLDSCYLEAMLRLYR